ncbi:hypothetical protein BYT27DRAFT_7116907 [Phlegmacium glaucopus]|nr:hypothetical protein BYT27DRAFT_7116907 [Phlegmacium glaucopus]
MDITVRDGYRGRREAFIRKRPAVAIITGYCNDSNLIVGLKGHKSIGVLFHGQEWERYCCFISMIFDEQNLNAQIYRSVLTFSTLPNSISAPPNFPNASLSPLSSRHAKTNDTPVEHARGALYFTDIVPVFDAQEINLNQETDFDNLQNIFPTFNGEIPIGSCVAVGHSVSSYLGKKTDVTNVHLATNILFVIVFGTPD